MAEQDVAALLPLKPAVFHILLALAKADLHGYGIMQGVREVSALLGWGCSIGET